MSEIIYDSADLYIECATDLRAKIARINAIITALENAAVKGAATGHLSEYNLDDGQTKIRTAYRNMEEVMQAIKSFEQIRQMYINRLNGRHVRLVDSKNFHRR